MVWEESYNELSARYAEYIKTQREKMSELQTEIESERKQWERRVRSERTRPGLGIFGGYGINGFTVGVGIVWRVM